MTGRRQRASCSISRSMSTNVCFACGLVMSPQSSDVVDVGRAANIQIDLIAPHHPPLDLWARVPGAHRKISRFLQN